MTIWWEGFSIIWQQFWSKTIIFAAHIESVLRVLGEISKLLTHNTDQFYEIRIRIRIRIQVVPFGPSL